MSNVMAAALPASTQSLSGWLLSPWIHMAGHLGKKKKKKSDLRRLGNTLTIMHKHLHKSSDFSFSPVTPHSPCEVITTLLRLHKDDGFIFFLSHDLFHQLNKSDDKENKKSTQVSGLEEVFC